LFKKGEISVQVVFFNYKKKKGKQFKRKLYNEKVLFLGWERVIYIIINIYIYGCKKKSP
jgi:hypothetical protein